MHDVRVVPCWWEWIGKAGDSMHPGNRIRQARRHAGLTQPALAERVGVHRSAVAQWERDGGSHPTTEHLARIALATSTSFEWLSTGRGRSAYLSDIIGGEETPAVLLEHSAQSELEVRVLVAMRRLEFKATVAIVEMAEAFANLRKAKLSRRTAYSQ